MSPDSLLRDRYLSRPNPVTPATLATYRVREAHRVATAEGTTLAANDTSALRTAVAS